ncbi:DUF3987 domain-containing protein [Aquirufa sp.]|jgi:hypothetical protein|uniref:DUF3987 domain-containing protein n=1 Tax=Aquirufa sp. TaxID=2676249 RepID=UPI003783A912
MSNTIISNQGGKAPFGSNLQTNIESRHSDIATSLNLDQITQDLPSTLRQCINLLDTYEERKIATYAVITLAGSLMPNVEINYDGSVNYPQLMLLISYPPASGKGKLNHMLELISSIDLEINEQSLREARKYKSDYDFYKSNLKKGDRKEQPVKPNLPLYLIPGNTTSSKLMQQLAENGESQVGLIFETETDALANMLGSTHGIDNSMMLRKVFHHESISQMRKTNNEHLMVAKPKLAIIVSGTPSQIPKLFSSNSDGLFSRFMIVSGSSPIVWKDVKPSVGTLPLSLQFKGLSSNFYLMWQHHASHKSLNIIFSESQWKRINDQGDYLQSICLEEGGENAVSISRRHMNMMARIASILTAVRHYESRSSEIEVECNTADFNIALDLSEYSFYQALELFKVLPGEVTKQPKRAMEFYYKLPDIVFTTYQIQDIILEMNVQIRMIQRYIRELINMGYLIEISKNRYKKIKK